MPSPRRTVTLASVAEHAGVSLKTASNAVNRTGRMSSDTRERVMASVTELGYKVHVAARNLTLDRTGTVTLAVPTLRAAYLAELADAVVSAARERDLIVHVTTYPSAQDGGSRDFLRTFNIHLSDGLLFSLPTDHTLGADDLAVDFPLVCLGSRDTFGQVDHVTTDDVADASLAAGFLYDRGSTSLAVVGAHTAMDTERIASAREGNADLRMRGILEATHAADRRLDPRLVAVTGYDWSIGAGFRATRGLLASAIDFDALMCLNDGLAIGAIAALREAGKRIPQDVQVIGFDDIEESAYLAPPLTTMDSQIGWITDTALERLAARVDESVVAPATMTAKSRLVVRATTR